MIDGQGVSQPGSRMRMRPASNHPVMCESRKDTAGGRCFLSVMAKLEICAIEDANPGVVYLYPEGTFYKAYQQSAWLLCSRISR